MRLAGAGRPGDDAKKLWEIKDAAAQFDPRRFDPARKPNRHFTFVAGVHLCLGAPLARRELRILLEEWFERIPEFRVKPGADTTVFPGLMSIRSLPLVWDPTRPVTT